MALLSVIVRDGDLRVGFEGRRPFILVHPVADNEFVLPPTGYSFVFPDPVDGSGRRLELHARSPEDEARVVHGERVSGPADPGAQPDAYVGLYYNRALGVTYRVEPGGGRWAFAVPPAAWCGSPCGG